MADCNEFVVKQFKTELTDKTICLLTLCAVLYLEHYNL